VLGRALALVIAIAATACATTATGGPALEWKALHGGPPTATMLVARSEVEWQRLAALFGLRPPLPRLDFSRQMVVAMGLGERPTGGFAVTIVGAEERRGVLYVRYEERRPRPEEMVTQALTTPYHVRVLPRSDAGQVVFERVEAGER
jgi:hypothetical protein